MRTASRTLFGQALLLATVTVGVLASGASAQPPPESGDPRATAYAGNIDIGQPGDACDELGLPGNEAVMPPGTYTNDGTYIDITGAHPDGVVTGVVVKGGPAYNVYPAGNLGPLPWLDLHSPLTASGKNPAEISHWFVCVEVPTPTTTTTVPGTTTTVPGTTTTTPGATTTTTVTTTNTTTMPAATTTTTKKPAPAVAGSDDELAATGVNSLWLLIGGSALVLAGAGALLASKLRGRPRR